MHQLATSRSDYLWRGIAAVVVPLAMISGYLFFSRWPTYQFTAASDLAGFGAAVLAGVILVGTMRLNWRARLFCIFIYTPLSWMILTIYSLYFVGVVFDEWL
jgi:hypothetical protein